MFSEMYKNILIPVSNILTARELVRLAIDLLTSNARLIVLHVIAIPQPHPLSLAEEKLEEARNLVKEAAVVAIEQGIVVKPKIVVARSIPEVIVKEAKLERCDLILMGSSQRAEEPEGVLFGNIVDEVLRYASCDIAVVSYRKYVSLDCNQILVPTSGYKHAEKAAEIAANLAKKHGGRATVLYVASLKEGSARAEDVINRAKLHFERLNVPNQAKVLFGSPSEEILKEAREGRYNLIMLGSTERDRNYAALLDAVADKVVAKSPCQVMVVKTSQ
jgi:nucleotide-binding universal stress UspA family protein